MCIEEPSGNVHLGSWVGNSEGRCGPEENMWEPMKLWGRYGEVKEGNCTGKKKKAKDQSPSIPIFEGHRDKEEPMKESKDRCR